MELDGTDSGGANVNNAHERNDELEMRQVLWSDRRKTVRLAWRLLILIAFVELIAIGALAWQGFQNHSANRKANLAIGTSAIAIMAVQRQEAIQQINILHSCQRLNVLRADDNHSAYADWKVFNVVIKVAINSQLRATLMESIAAKAWIPLTNCLAVSRSVSAGYKVPQEIPFSSHLPPKSALDPVNAARPTPAGSVP